MGWFSWESVNSVNRKKKRKTYKTHQDTSRIFMISIKVTTCFFYSCSPQEMMVNKSPQLPAPVLAGTVEASPAVLAAAKESWAERGRTVPWGLHWNWWCWLCPS
jgi:nicotinamide riboside transporter PnuC